MGTRRPNSGIAATDARLEVMRAEFDQRAAGEPTDTEVLRDGGDDLPERIRRALAAGNVSGPARDVLEHALAVRHRWEQEASETPAF
jgi:hypothetical protein